MKGGVLKEVDERGSTKGEDMVEEAISRLLLAALVLLLEDDGLDGVEDIFLLSPTPLFCHNKALAPLLIALP